MKPLQLLHDFTRVDGEADPDAFVNYVDAVSSVASAQEYKRLTFQLLDVKEGDRVLDVGCGTGEDARILARVVGPRGRVVGVDSSRTMIDEACHRLEDAEAPVEFRVGDAYGLGFADGSFDACRADRVFQHLSEPRRALAEMIRVTRPGGHIAVSDPDWGTMAINGCDRELTRRILGFACDSAPDGWMGRQLPGLFREAGILEVRVHSFLITFEEYALARDLFGIERIAQGAAQTSVVSVREAEEWLQSLREDDAAGRFLCALGGFTASGIRP
jgi:SAM-dependent methyltransferase